MFDSFDSSHQGMVERRYSSDHLQSSSLASSRNSSTTSLSSHKSEPGWLTSRRDVDGSHGHSAAPQARHKTLKGLFSKKKGKKEKSAVDSYVFTSKYAAAVQAKLASDSKSKHAIRRGAHYTQRVVGTQSSQHLTAEQQEMRHPHSGPPALHAREQADMPVLTRIVSGDEADEPDEWQRLRCEWNQKKEPGLEMVRVIEGQSLDGSTSGATTPEEACDADELASKLTQLDIKVSSLVNAAAGREKHHTPIGGRWTRDEKGVWKR